MNLLSKKEIDLEYLANHNYEKQGWNYADLEVWKKKGKTLLLENISNGKYLVWRIMATYK